MGTAYKVVVGKPEGKRPHERPMRKWEDNLVTGLCKHCPLPGNGLINRRAVARQQIALTLLLRRIFYWNGDYKICPSD
jgi:hypothetical protein